MTGRSSILVVDDDVDMRGCVADALEDEGFDVIEAENGRVALDVLLEGARPTVILLDLMMPVMDGFAFRVEQQRNPEIAAIPVIVFTAHATPRDTIARIGASAFLSKPFGLDVLLSTVGRFRPSGRGATVDGAVGGPSDDPIDDTVLGPTLAAQGRAPRLSESSEAMLRGLVDQVQAGIARADVAGRFTFADDRYREIVGRSAPELLHTRIEDITRPEDRPALADGLARVIATGSPLVIEERHVKPDGSLVWVQSSYSRIDDAEGRAQGVTLVAIDISDRVAAHERVIELQRTTERLLRTSREGEEAQARRAHLAAFAGDVGAAFTAGGELRAILMRCCELAVQHLEIAVARIWMLDEAGTMLELQASAGPPPPEEPGDDEPDDGSAWARVELTAAQRRSQWHDAVANDPRLCDPGWARREGIVAFVGHPLVVEDELVGVLALFSRSALAEDTSSALAAVARTIAIGIERSRGEEQRGRLLHELRQTLRFSQMFIGILGHDLRNPLGAIMTAAELLLRRETHERVVRPAERIRTSAHRMARMIEQILDFTRARIGGGIPITPVPVDLHRLATQLVEELEGVSPQEILLESCGHTVGEWDGDRLAQVISNLLGNAADHGRPDTPIRLRLDGTAADVVRMSVWNAGAIPEQVLSVLFDPFRRATAGGRVHKPSGLGLGLYVIQQIVHAHGGSIDASSSASEGTVFTVVLPRAADSRTPRSDPNPR